MGSNRYEPYKPMKNNADNIRRIFLNKQILMMGCLLLSALWTSVQAASDLPALDTRFSPIDPQNRAALIKRLVAVFDSTYLKEMQTRGQQNLTGNMAFYYLRQELQALVDMWRATNNKVYLEQARLRASKAITDAQKHTRPLLRHGQERGQWPCFLFDKVASVTGGHSQLVDFQGATGLLMAARALQLANMEGANILGTFVEESIVAKWARYNPNITLQQLRGDQAGGYLMSILESGRDKREHFAVMCMDLHHLGAQGLPYGPFATLLTMLYVGPRPQQNTTPPFAEQLRNMVPRDWGLMPKVDTAGLIWRFAPSLQQDLQIIDTSHANRTVWLATRAFTEGLLPQAQVEGLIRTMKRQIWQPQKGPFYFNNLVDGTDTEVQGLGPGRKGNVWFGWHRLAAYDTTLRDLFVSMAYDLTNGGKNFPKKAQNQSMVEARLCLYAWVARLLAPEGQPQVFP